MGGTPTQMWSFIGMKIEPRDPVVHNNKDLVRHLIFLCVAPTTIIPLAAPHVTAMELHKNSNRAAKHFTLVTIGSSRLVPLLCSALRHLPRLSTVDCEAC